MIMWVCIISFLLFFANILALLAHYVTLWWAQVQEKLWIYLYLRDNSAAQDVLYSELIEMKTELEEAWLGVTFYSKDDAFELLEQRLPNVIGSLERYGIANPLPSTLYVTFSNQQEYTILKDVILAYEHIIVNLDDVTGTFSFGAQEQRIATVVNLSEVIRYLSYFLIAIIVLIIIVFLQYAININFFAFRKQLEVEALLWAPYDKIAAPFLLYAGSMLLGAFLLTGGYLRVLVRNLSTYIESIFDQSLALTFPSWQQMLVFGLGEVIIISVIWILFARVFVGKLLRRI